MDYAPTQFKLFLLDQSSIIEEKWFLGISPDMIVSTLKSIEEAFAQAHMQADILVVFHESLDLEEIFISNFLALSPKTKIIFIGSPLPIKKVTKSLRMGVWEYLDIQSNFKEDLKVLIKTEIKNQLSPLKNKNSLVEQFRQLGIIGNSKLSIRVYKKVIKAALVDSTILILGESGTGKELVARTIHKLSKRKEGPLVFVDCLSWPPELLEKELFGQEKNIFEGIIKRQIGKIEVSSGGSIILDNAQALPLNVQEKLLRALQERKFIRPGGSNIVFFNARLIVVSSKDLQQSMQRNEIRKDLYYQLMGFLIQIYPVRKKVLDIPILANFFLEQFLYRNKLKSIIFTQEAKEKLIEYSYPGNVRELKTIVESSAIMATGSEIGSKDLSFPSPSPFLLENWLERGLSLEEISHQAIKYYLKKHNGNAIKAAKELKIGKSTIYRLLKSI